MNTLKRLVRSPVVLFCTAIVILSLLIKWKLFGFTSYDTGILTYWYDYLYTHGFQGFRDSFANYNAPYLYLLWLVSNFPIEKLVAIKLLSVCFDFLLAIAVYFFVKNFRKKGNAALYAATFSLVLPTVLLNGAFWGQCDALYTALGIFAITFAIQKRSWWAWIFFGLAISFKLQAIFMLPILAYIWLLYRKKDTSTLLSPLAAPVVFLIGVLPTILVGKPIGEIINMYRGLTSQESLTLNAPTLYQWVPNSVFEYFNSAGILIAMTVTGIVLWFAYQHLYKKRAKKPSLNEVTLLPLLLLITIPFLLPQMHERYFFSAELFAYLVAFVLGGRWILVAILLQVVALVSYGPYLFDYESSLLPYAAVIVLGVIIYIAYQLFGEQFRKYVKTKTDF